MPYAIFKTGGKQYRVAEGDVLDVEKLDGEDGKEMKFSEVLFFGDGGKFKSGDALKSASVVAEIVGQIKAKKLIAYKYKRCKGYHRTVGHRQKLTRVRITSIAA